MKTYRMMTPDEIRDAADQMIRDGTQSRSFVVGMRGLRLEMTLRKRARKVYTRWVYKRFFADGEYQKSIGTWPAVSVGAAIEAAARLEAELDESRPQKAPVPVVEHFTMSSEVRLPNGRLRTVTIDYLHDVSSCIKVHEDGMPLKTFRASGTAFKPLREVLTRAATGQLSDNMKELQGA